MLDLKYFIFCKTHDNQSSLARHKPNARKKRSVEARLNVHNKQSNINQVHMGVPQGTIPGPLLFLVYVNDFSSSIPDTFLSMYADDSSAVVTGNTVHEAVVKLNICLNKLSHCLK